MLSIIIPTLNEEHHLPRLLDSIAMQEYTDYEIIVADAGSQDATVTLAKERGCRVVPGGVLTVGRNNGAREARGDILLFLDADVVLWEATFLWDVLAEFTRRWLGVAGVKLIPDSDKFIDKLAYNIYARTAVVTQNILAHAAAAIIAKKSVHEAIGWFDEEIIFVEDHPYVRAASKVAKFGFIKKEFVLVSVRRYDKDGRWRTFTKYIIAGIYITLIGPIKSDIFHYKFAHYDEEKLAQKK
jgi:glycosyltransferase involved in cell wall biosynthesis